VFSWGPSTNILGAKYQILYSMILLLASLGLGRSLFSMSFSLGDFDFVSSLHSGPPFFFLFHLMYSLGV
jgi:hypothetical protein